MELRCFRFQLFCNSSQWPRIGVLALLWLQTIGVGFTAKAIAQTPLRDYLVHLASGPCGDPNKPAVLYTGKTYGYLRANDSPYHSAASAFRRSYDYVSRLCPQAILVGMGDNLAPEYGARLKIHNGTPEEIGKGEFIERLNPTAPREPLLWPPLPGPWTTWTDRSPAVLFFKEVKHRYDALVPGQLDFYFGADFLAHAGAENELPMLGANLVIQKTMQVPQSQPTCAAPQLLLPAQVSLPIQSGAGSGGGKGKGGKGGGGAGGGAAGGGGGGSNQGSSGSASGQSSSAKPGQTCLQQETSDSGDANNLKLVSPSGDSLYPWSSEFQVSLPDTFTDLNGLFLCPWDASRVTLKDHAINTNKCVRLETPNAALKPSQKVPLLSWVKDEDIPIQEDGLPKDADPLKDHSLLLPDQNIQLCATRSYTKNDNKKAELCTRAPLLVHRPFFPRAWVRVSPTDSNGHPYVQYAIFGALDPALTGLISPENSSFGDNDEYTSQIKIPDPALALEQLRITFQRLHPDKSTSWTYVLLAQMPRSAAQALSAALQWDQDHPPAGILGNPSYHFDVVLSAAAYDEATPDMELTLDQVKRPTPVITPHPIVTGSTMRNPLALLEVDSTSVRHTRYTNHTDQDRDPNPVIVDDGSFSAACQSYDIMTHALNQLSEDYLNARPEISQYRKMPSGGRNRDACSFDSAFQCLTLDTMREQLSADVAFLQQNDFYSGCNYEGPVDPLGWAPTEAVGRVLWNSGYLTRVSVSGATLRAILQNSDKIKQQEQSSTSEPIVRKQNLVYLGVTKSNGLYFVDGVAVDDNKIYSVATSDQLAFETSAYPQFGQVDLVSPSVFTGWSKETYAIEQLASLPFLPPTQASALDRDQLVSTGPLEGGPQKAPQGPKSVPLGDASATELGVQNRNLLTITLQQASIGYMNSKPSQTDANINTNLSGVTNPNVASPHSDNLSYSDAFRLLYQWTAHWNLGFDQLITFARSRQGLLTSTVQKTPTGQVLPSESINLSANTLIVSPFFEYQPHRYQGGHWKLVARPVTFSTQLSRTLQFLPTMTTGVSYELNLRRQENWQPSVGGRYEWNNLNFFEAGYLNQTARNVLSALNIDGTVTQLTAGETAAKAAMITPPPNSTATPIYGTFHQQGGYWLGLLTHDLTRSPKQCTVYTDGTSKCGRAVKITYQGITYGNFFAYGAADRTSTALTRYAAELSNNLQVQLWGNISVGPSYNIFWFQDQSHSPGDNLTRRDWNLQLNYLFDWHQGLEWKYSLAGKTSQ